MGFFRSRFHPKYWIDSYRQESECKKVRSGMLVKAMMKRDIDISNSVLTRECFTDMEAGLGSGVKNLLFLGRSTEADEFKDIRHPSEATPYFGVF